MGFPGSSAGKESTCKAGDLGSIPGSGRSPGDGIGYPLQYSWASLVAQLVKNPPAMREKPGLDPWVGKIPWRRAWQPIPVFLPGESDGQRSLVGYSPWGPQRVGHKESGHDWAAQHRRSTSAFKAFNSEKLHSGSGALPSFHRWARTGTK